MYANTLYGSKALSDDFLDEVIAKGNDLITGKKEEVDEAIDKAEEQVKSNIPVVDKEKESFLTKVKRKFNDQDPLLIGAVGAGVSWLAFKTGPITTAVVGAVCYFGKMQLDKNGGLSDSFNTNDMIYASRSANGLDLYKNLTNGRLYYVSGYDNRGIPEWTQYN